MKNEYCIVMTTVETEKQSEDLINKVLEEKMAACIQTRQIESHYVWNNEVCHEKEILIWFKTKRCLYNELENAIKQVHPYDCPEIISVPIHEISKEYSAWMNENLQNDEKR